MKKRFSTYLSLLVILSTFFVTPVQVMAEAVSNEEPATQVQVKKFEAEAAEQDVATSLKKVADEMPPVSESAIKPALKKQAKTVKERAPAPDSPGKDVSNTVTELKISEPSIQSDQSVGIAVKFDQDSQGIFILPNDTITIDLQANKIKVGDGKTVTASYDWDGNLTSLDAAVFTVTVIPNEKKTVIKFTKRVLERPYHIKGEAGFSVRLKSDAVLKPNQDRVVVPVHVITGSKQATIEVVKAKAGPQRTDLFYYKYGVNKDKQWIKTAEANAKVLNWMLYFNYNKWEMEPGSMATVHDEIGPGQRLIKNSLIISVPNKTGRHTDYNQTEFENKFHTKFKLNVKKNTLDISIPSEVINRKQVTVWYQTKVTNPYQKEYKNWSEVWYQEKGKRKTHRANTHDTQWSVANFYYGNISGTRYVTKIKAKKIWNDEHNRYNSRPSSITVELLKDGKRIGDGVFQTLTPAMNWQSDDLFGELPREDAYDNHRKCNYSVREVNTDQGKLKNYTYDGVTTTGDNSFELKNTLKRPINIKGQKIWKDNKNSANTRPKAIDVVLLADGEINGYFHVMPINDKWEYEFNDLPEFNKEGKKIHYTVKEAKVPAGYTSKVDGNNIVNTLKTIKISGQKHWEDEDDIYGVRPDKIIVELLKNGQKFKQQTVTAQNKWKYTFDKLMETDNNGDKIKYTIKEINPSQFYKPEYNASNYDITNKLWLGEIDIKPYDPKSPLMTKVSGVKQWHDDQNRDHKRPLSIQVQLYADGQAQGAPITVTANQDWKYSFDKLHKYKKGKQEIKYSVKEVGVPTGYTTKVDGYNIINTYAIATTQVSGHKVWQDDGNHPAQIVVGLYDEQGNVVQDVNHQAVRPITVTATNGWQYMFTNLPKNDLNGQPIQYIVKEIAVPKGYQSTEGNAQNNYTITNTRVGKTDLTVKKAWVNDAKYVKRPTTVQVQLLRNNQPQEVQELTQDNNWEYKFKDLAKFDAQGQPYHYDVKEIHVPAGYTPTYVVNDKVITITNTYKPKTTAIKVAKTWQDEGQHPDTLAVKLVATINGKEFASYNKTLKLSAKNNWKMTVKDIPVEYNHQKVTYTVQEIGAKNKQIKLNGLTYDVKISGDANKGFEITNTLVGTTSFKVHKQWEDQNDFEHMRPTELKVILKDQFGKAYPQTLTKANHWSYTYSDLPAYQKGVKLQYHIEEAQVPGYTATQIKNAVNDVTLKNTHQVNQRTVHVVKQWVNDRAEFRPQAIFVKLTALANGQEIPALTRVEKITPKLDGSWGYDFNNLPNNYGVNHNLQYHVMEVADKKGNALPGTAQQPEMKVSQGKYVGTVTQNQDNVTITNKFISRTKDISGTKTWVDNNDQDGQRPDYIKVKLIAKDHLGQVVPSLNKEETFKFVHPENNKWTYTFKDVDVYYAGHEVQYSVKEMDVPAGYQATEKGMDITNTHKMKEISLNITKAWKNTPAEQMLDAVYVKVLAFDANHQELPAVEKMIPIQKVTKDNNWKLKVTVPENWTAANGVDHCKVNYQVKEVLNAQGEPIQNYQITAKNGGVFTTAVSGNQKQGFVITNSYKSFDKTLIGTKTWDDNNNQDGLRPGKIEVKLIAIDADGNHIDELEKTKTVVDPKGQATNTWQFSFANKPEYYQGKKVTYSVKEINVPNGYQTTAQGMNITNTHTPIVVPVEISKIDLAGKEIVGAHIQIRDAKGKLVKDGDWISNQETHKLKLNVGKYTFHEEAAPNGYKKVTDLTFEVGNDGKVKNVQFDSNDVVELKDNKLIVTDDYQKHDIEISKVDLAGKEINGARIQIKDAKGNVVKDGDWVSDSKTIHKLKGLKPGKYTFHEEAAPNGYKKVTDLTFTIDLNGQIGSVDVQGSDQAKAKGNKLIVTDEDINVEISKVGLGGKEIAGAKIEIKKDGKLVEKWTSEKDTTHIWKNVAEGDYEFHEIAAPTGYQKVTVIKFHVDDKGNVTVKDKHPHATATGNKMTVTDQVAKLKIHVKKTWNDTNNQDGLRTPIKIHLYANKTEKDNFEISGPTWEWTSQELPVLDENGLIDYEVKEDQVSGYDKPQYKVEKTTNKIDVIITNTHQTKVTDQDIVINKVWKDKNNQDGMRPELIKVKLIATAD
ncbi:Cna B-type domain-containing protein, partial [Ligilactobacillus ceti]